MLINPFEVKDYLSEAKELITDQFKDKVVFNKHLELILHPRAEIQEVYRQLMQERSLDTAYGAQLDILGSLVGQPRTLINADLESFFGFLGDITADSFGTIGDPSVGSVYWDGIQARTGDITLVDDLYRTLIKAKILKNVTRATPEDMMRFCNFVFSTDSSTVQNEGGGQFTMAVGKLLSKQEVGLLRWINTSAYYDSTLLPKPVGVRIDFAHFNGEKFFAFDGVPGAQGFGTISYDMFYNGEYTHSGKIPTIGPEKVDGVEIGGYYASFIKI